MYTSHMSASLHHQGMYDDTGFIVAMIVVLLLLMLATTMNHVCTLCNADTQLFSVQDVLASSPSYQALVYNVTMQHKV